MFHSPWQLLTFSLPYPPPGHLGNSKIALIQGYRYVQTSKRFILCLQQQTLYLQNEDRGPNSHDNADCTWGFMAYIHVHQNSEQTLTICSTERMFIPNVCCKETQESSFGGRDLLWFLE